MHLRICTNEYLVTISIITKRAISITFIDNNYRVPALIITNPWLTDAGLPETSMYTSQPYPSVSFLTSSITLHFNGLRTTSAPHLRAISSLETI